MKYFSVALFVLWGTPVYGQSFDALLNELTGSEADQAETEAPDQVKKKEHVAAMPLSSEMTASTNEDAFAPEKNSVMNGVTLQGLDKQTARVFILDAAIGQPVEFGSLKIIVHHCEQTPLDDRQESMAFLSIREEKADGKSPPTPLFAGWMFASSPALSALEHPVYDVWIKGCKTLDTIKKTQP